MAEEAGALSSLVAQLRRELAAVESEASARVAAADDHANDLQPQLQAAATALRAAQTAEALSQAALRRHQVPLSLPPMLAHQGRTAPAQVVADW